MRYYMELAEKEPGQSVLAGMVMMMLMIMMMMMMRHIMDN